VHDEKMLEIISKHGIKATFNICSGCYGDEEHKSNLTKEKAIELYNAHDCEVAVHGKNHLPLTEVDRLVAFNDILECRDDIGIS
jgi:peptidoglycan/xylan/chitin deacetylase (PgdA/CDA1 family)